MLQLPKARWLGRTAFLFGWMMCPILYGSRLSERLAGEQKEGCGGEVAGCLNFDVSDC